MHHLSITPVSGELFEETIDGYFPLAESIRHMMVRNRFETAWISIVQAPIMNIPGLPPTSPVPLRLQKGWVGTIQRMCMLAINQNERLYCRGAGAWSWFHLDQSEEEAFNPLTRLAEPAFIRGIGLHEGNLRTKCHGNLCQTKKSNVAIATVTKAPATKSNAKNLQNDWKSARFWSLGKGLGSHICRDKNLRKIDMIYGASITSLANIDDNDIGKIEFICTLQKTDYDHQKIADLLRDCKPSNRVWHLSNISS